MRSPPFEAGFVFLGHHLSTESPPGTLEWTIGPMAEVVNLPEAPSLKPVRHVAWGHREPATQARGSLIPRLLWIARAPVGAHSPS